MCRAQGSAGSAAQRGTGGRARRSQQHWAFLAASMDPVPGRGHHEPRAEGGVRRRGVDQRWRQRVGWARADSCSMWSPSSATPPHANPDVPGATIHARRQWTVTPDALVLAEDPHDEETTDSGHTPYLLEDDLAREVIDVGVRGGVARSPAPKRRRLRSSPTGQRDAARCPYSPASAVTDPAAAGRLASEGPGLGVTGSRGEARSPQ